MSITVNINSAQKQSIAISLTAANGSTDTTTTISVFTSPNPPTAIFTVEAGADNRHFWIVGQGAGSGTVTFAANGKQDTATVNVSAAPPPDLSSLVASLDGSPVAK